MSCNGCCSFGICVGLQFQSQFSCGSNGATCAQCPNNNTCVSGTCKPSVVDAGMNISTGSACQFDGQCQPPANGVCIPQTVVGNQTGWPGGYCSQGCGSSPCAAGSSCLNVSDDVAAPNFLCMKSCVGPRSGQSSCRASYVCEIDFGSVAGQGICLPRCDSPGFTCWPGTTCNLMTGYCMT